MIDFPITKSNSTNYFIGEIELGNMKKAIWFDCTIIHKSDRRSFTAQVKNLPASVCKYSEIKNLVI